MNVWYHLFDGNLTDIPGRCESWTEEVCCLAKDEWLIRIRGTDFSGMEERDVSIESRTSEGIVDWLDVLDVYDQEMIGCNPFYDNESLELIGERLKRLKVLSAILEDDQVYSCICSLEHRRFGDLSQEFQYIEDSIVEELEPLVKEQLSVKSITIDDLNEAIDKLVEAQKFEIDTSKSSFDEYYLKKIIPSNFFDGDGAYYEWCKNNDLYWEALRKFIQNHVVEHKRLPTGIHSVSSGTDETSINEVDFDWLHELCELQSSATKKT
jgi:hypothetical protein